MTTFIEQRLSSPGWWFDYVWTPLAVLLIVYVLGRGYSRFTTWRATNSAAKRTYRARLVAGVRADPARLLWLGLEANTCRLRAMTALLLGALLMTMWMFARFVEVPRSEHRFEWAIVEWFIFGFTVLAVFAGGAHADRATLLEGVLKEFEPDWPETTPAP